eukprot:TRINITY_DN12297_c0_g3_i4.p2 TRINITY_DN12297_c0_g3~~TRINITY_DN12297_c0_g3_i4.p2  ORF type:complete len:137 (+),score=17.57 TRINITY_DN12297_c0_g3_i4:410-820(+)
MEDYQVKRCRNYEKCRGSFCTGCLKRHFKRRMKKERVKLRVEWICLICRGMCHCPKCQLELRNEFALLQQGIEFFISLENKDNLKPSVSFASTKIDGNYKSTLSTDYSHQKSTTNKKGASESDHRLNVFSDDKGST